MTERCFANADRHLDTAVAVVDDVRRYLKSRFDWSFYPHDATTCPTPILDANPSLGFHATALDLYALPAVW